MLNARRRGLNTFCMHMYDYHQKNKLYPFYHTVVEEDIDKVATSIQYIRFVQYHRVQLLIISEGAKRRILDNITVNPTIF